MVDNISPAVVHPCCSGVNKSSFMISWTQYQISHWRLWRPFIPHTHTHSLTMPASLLILLTKLYYRVIYLLCFLPSPGLDFMTCELKPQQENDPFWILASLCIMINYYECASICSSSYRNKCVIKVISVSIKDYIAR